jgi:hypothetical protein
MLDAPTHDAPSKITQAPAQNKAKKKHKGIENLRPFKKGQSGNPGGRPKKQLTEKQKLDDLVRGYADEAINTYVACLRAEEAPWPAKVSAATAILERGFGKPSQQVDMNHNVTISDAFEKLISRINGDTGPVLDAEAEDIQQIEAAE